MSTRLPIYEIFHTWQGEGLHMGRSAFFIRTFGCPVHCPWCDSAGTWHPDHVPEKIERHQVEELADAAAEARPDFVVITGGEPAIHDLRPLTEALAARDLPAHIETSGAFPLRGDFAWVTVSPKIWKAPLPEMLRRADELKLIIDSVDAVDYWLPRILPEIRAEHVWLHPEWSVARDPAVLREITTAVKEHGAPLRAGYQLHKLYAADAMDPRAKQEGNPRPRQKPFGSAFEPAG